MSYTFLIVDDSRTMRKIIRRSLLQAGIGIDAVLEANNGTEALVALKMNPGVDLILSDVNMPRMDGLSFVHAIAEKFQTPPPVVMITSERSADVEREAMGHGARGYLTKPFTPEQMRDVLGPLLPDEQK